MEVTVDIEGLKGVEDALAGAGPELAKRAMRKALRAGGKVLLEAARNRAPVLTKATPKRIPGALRDSLTMKVQLSPKQESGVVHVGSQYKGGGHNSPAVYGKWVEFGSVHNPQPQPFMRPAFDSASKDAEEAFTEVMRAEVEKLGKA